VSNFSYDYKWLYSVDVSDYVDLARELIKIAKDCGAKDDLINKLLNSNTMNHGQAINLENIRIFL
jgi:hypothetical protein